MYKIKDLPFDERPQERLIALGASFLSDEELLAILLKTGTKEYSVKVLAAKLLVAIGGIAKMHETNLIKLQNIKGIGRTKAVTIMAAIELARRMKQNQRYLMQKKIVNSQMVYEYFKDKIATAQQEHFYCLYLNSQRQVISEKLLFTGTINKSLIHPREIFKEAFLVSAYSIICVHNHPSGDPNPSAPDIALTKDLREMAELFAIAIDDHIIVGNNSFYSFHDNRLFKNEKV